MTGIFYTADLHLGHRFVAGLRGFGEDADAHDAHLARQWDAVVGRDDQVWVLGDLTMRSDPAPALAWIRDRPGIKHFVAGNHDRCHPMHRDAHKYQRVFLEAFESVQAFARRRFDGRPFLLSHFPYSADRGETRYAQYRLADCGELLLHGHTHSTERLTSPTEVHVGVDAWGFAPAPQHLVLACVPPA